MVHKATALPQHYRSYLDKSAHLPDDTLSLGGIVCPCLQLS